jgi:hypothetical protein
LAITPTTAQETNEKSDSSRSNQEGSSDEQNMRDLRKISSAGGTKKTSIDNTKGDDKSKKQKGKGKEEVVIAGDKSERSSSPAFDSDEDDSVGNTNQQKVQTLPVPGTKKRTPSIAGLLVRLLEIEYNETKTIFLRDVILIKDNFFF